MVMAILLAAYAAHGASRPQETQTLPVNDYRIGAKDLLEIAVFELPELNQTVRVSEDGSITLSLLGKVEVAGLTAQELEKKLATLLDQQFTKGAHVTVFIKEYQKVSVIGAVGRPGQYELIGPTTLLHAIAQAGGLTGQAMNELIVYRQGNDGKPEMIVIRLDDLTVGGNQDLNILLQPKDVVTVPIDQTLNVFVYGEVKSPGAIPYLSSKKITLVQAIAQAGGPTEWAKRSRVMIKRKDRKTGKEIQIHVNLKKMISGKIADIMLEEGDVIIVP
ncbi:MAG: polysaccharide export protein [Candidatus Aminicenantes bacterium]|nr:polysaccharide export protein [Candidatus Aminicenantes bacterium]